MHWKQVKELLRQLENAKLTLLPNRSTNQNQLSTIEGTLTPSPLNNVISHTPNASCHCQPICLIFLPFVTSSNLEKCC
jgi:hypothetical protein